MPIYEYECESCRRRVSLLILRPSTAPPPTCPRCGSTALHRLMSRFATVKSEEARLEALADGGLGDVDENDPTSVARFMKKMGKEFGEDMGGEDFDEAVDEAMAEASEDDGEERPASAASSDPDSGDL